MRLFVFALLSRNSRPPRLLAEHVSRLDPNPARGRAASPGTTLPPVPTTQPKAQRFSSSPQLGEGAITPTHNLAKSHWRGRYRRLWHPSGLAMIQTYKQVHKPTGNMEMQVLLKWERVISRQLQPQHLRSEHCSRQSTVCWQPADTCKCKYVNIYFHAQNFL